MWFIKKATREAKKDFLGGLHIDCIQFTIRIQLNDSYHTAFVCVSYNTAFKQTISTCFHSFLSNFVEIS